MEQIGLVSGFIGISGYLIYLSYFKTKKVDILEQQCIMQAIGQD